MNNNAAALERIAKIAANMKNLGALGVPVKPECVVRWADELDTLSATITQPDALTLWNPYEMLRLARRMVADSTDAGDLLALSRIDECIGEESKATLTSQPSEEAVATAIENIPEPATLKQGWTDAQIWEWALSKARIAADCAWESRRIRNSRAELADYEAWERIATRLRALSPAGGDLHHAVWSMVRPYIQPAAREKVNAALKEILAASPQQEPGADGCGACGDSCANRGACRLEDDSPTRLTATSAGTTGDDSEDAARLDWLESQFKDGVHVEGCYSGAFSAANLQRHATVFYGSREAKASTIRDAIDAARRAREAG